MFLFEKIKVDSKFTSKKVWNLEHAKKISRGEGFV
jgi:hypothetical protein